MSCREKNADDNNSVYQKNSADKRGQMMLISSFNDELVNSDYQASLNEAVWNRIFSCFYFGFLVGYVKFRLLYFNLLSL